MVKKYGELYLDARKALRKTEGGNAAVCARELLSLASGKSVAALLADRELYASEAIEARLNEYLARMLRGEPLAYILGRWSFYGMELIVTPDVLIPRDDTMAVTDLAIDTLRTLEQPARVLDLCTGSGCIGLAIAHHLDRCNVTLCDVSPKALAVAKQNIAALRLKSRVTAFEADVTKPASRFLGQFDLIVANPPYVTRAEMLQLQPSVREFEPHLALDGGADGLDFYRAIVDNFSCALKKGGFLCLEFGFGQYMAVGMLLESSGYTDIRFRKDALGVIRAVVAQK